MFSAAARLLPHASTFLRQIVPPVIATLIAAVLIQGYNRAFSSNLKQPRMAALHASEPTDAVDVTAGRPAAPFPEYVAVYERTGADRLADKDSGREAVKDATAIKLVTAPTPAPLPAAAAVPARSAALTPAAKPPHGLRPEPRIAGSAPLPATAVAPPYVAPPVTTPIAVAPVPSEPPPVIVAVPQTYAIAPQGPHEPPVSEAPPPPPRGALGAIADALNPVQLFSRARQFGEKIEQTGNDILPNIRQ